MPTDTADNDCDREFYPYSIVELEISNKLNRELFDTLEKHSTFLKKITMLTPLEEKEEYKYDTFSSPRRGEPWTVEGCPSSKKDSNTQEEDNKYKYNEWCTGSTGAQIFAAVSCIALASALVFVVVLV